MTTIITIISAIVTSQAIFGFIQFAITRRDTKKNIEGKLTTLEKDTLRTQLLFLIIMQPEEKHEILTIAEHYFSKPPKGLDGNWYLTSIFNRWLSDMDIAEPEWFDSSK